MFDHGAKFGIERRPAEFAAGECAIADESGGIAGATRALLNGYGAAGHLFGGADDIANGESAFGSEVICGARGAGEQSFEGEFVRLAEIDDVDVIAEAGAVGGGVISSLNGESRSGTSRGLEGQGDKMCFGKVPFSDAGEGVGAGGVEITK